MLILIGLTWMFIVVLMAAAEGTSPQGSWVGAFFTLLGYGVMPLSIVLYIMATPIRRQRRAFQEAQAARESALQAASRSAPADAEQPVHPD